MADVVVKGDTSGAVTLSAPAVAGTVTVTLPATSGTMAVLPTATGVLTEANGGTGTTTGYYGFKNRLINGGAQIGQRGNVVFSATNNLYGWCDRWLMSISGTTVSALGYQASSQPTKTGYAVQFGNVITTGATTITVTQRIESFNCADLNSNSVTFSGQVKQTTGSTQTLTISMSKANAVDNFTGVTSLGSTTISIPNNTWTPFTYTLALGSTDASNGISVSMAYGSLGAQSTTQFFYGDLQLEKGSTATSFDYRPYGTELALCQRYCQVITGVNYPLCTGLSYTTTNCNGIVALPVTMRISPTPTYAGATDFVITNGSGGGIACTAIGNFVYSPNTLELSATVASGLTAGQASIMRTSTGGTAKITLSAEL